MNCNSPRVTRQEPLWERTLNVVPLRPTLKLVTGPARDVSVLAEHLAAAVQEGHITGIVVIFKSDTGETDMATAGSLSRDHRDALIAELGIAHHRALQRAIEE